MGSGEWGVGSGEWGMGLRLALSLRRALSRAVEPEWGMGNGKNNPVTLDLGLSVFK